MDSQDIRTLRLLEAFEEEEQTSQRELARRLDISLGLVNAFLKRLARKGYFKITNLPANRVKYLLTPKGMAEKSRLTYEYIQYSFIYYRQTRTRLAEIFQRLAKQRAENLVFWGAGELAEIAYVSLADTRLKLAAIVDPERAGTNFLGRQVAGAGALAALDYDFVLLTAMTPPEKFLAEAETAGVAREKIIFI